MGAISGAIGGAFGGYANFSNFGVVGTAACSAAGGALGALVTGGDPGIAAASAGITAGISAGFNIDPIATAVGVGSSAEQFIKELIVSTGVGGLAGGVTAEIFGGDFGQGFVSGAASAAAAYIITRSFCKLYEDDMAMRSSRFADPKDIDVEKYIKERAMLGKVDEEGARYCEEMKPMFDVASDSLDTLYYKYGKETDEYYFWGKEDGRGGYIRHIIRGSLDGFPNSFFRGSYKHIKFEDYMATKPENAVFLGHSHGRGGLFSSFKNERFSGVRGGNYGDIGVAETLEVHMFLVTPKGHKWHYDYRNGNINYLGRVK